MLAENNEEKSYQQVLAEFLALRRQVFIHDEREANTVQAMHSLQQQLLQVLERNKQNSKAVIENAQVKKTKLIRKLVTLEKVKDRVAQDEIIKELEEYSRITRHREAQLARITKEIADINLSKDEYQQQFERKQKASDAKMPITERVRH